MKVLVALSSGIDSAFTAYLLKKQGYEVSAGFMKLIDNKEAEKKAKRIAEFLKIPFFIFDFRKEFKKTIINSFLEDIKRGDTPNPCVLCNRDIKFGLFLKKTKGLIATGHYAIKKDNKIFKAKDKEKDQSYFLWKLDQKQIKRTIFPLGNYTKKQVREEVKKLKFPSAFKKESQDVCFIDQDFKTKIKEKKGKIIDEKGKELGEHKGIWFYTIGQRKGIGLAGGPYYVYKKDKKNNILFVSKNENLLRSKELKMKNINWISGKTPKFPLKAEAKIRYGHKGAKALVYKNKVEFLKPQRAITPGQSVVFYQGKELVGGGIII